MTAAKHHKTVAVIERYFEVGGGTTHWGTIPSKALRHAAKILHDVRRNPLLREVSDASSLTYPQLLSSANKVIDTQVATYNSAVASFGREYADRTSARPGHSEHQMGTTTDVGARGLFLEDFIASPEAAWLAANAYRFGFVVSYPDGKEGITGYAYEPWHIRYVGKAVAQQVKDSGLTLHEFLLR